MKTKFSWNEKHCLTKTKSKTKYFKIQRPSLTINLHVIDKYFRCSIFLSVFWIHIRNWDHVWYKIFSRFWMFRVLSDIHLGPGSVRIIPITQNTTKQDPFGIYVGFGSVRIHFYRIGFGSGFRVRFICPALSDIQLFLSHLQNVSFFKKGNFSRFL